MAGRPWVLSETTWSVVRESQYDVAILPWGATEAHNLHLPYGTDVYESDAVAAEAARLAWERGARPLVLPTVPFGANAQQLDIPGTINMHPSTQMAVLLDVIESLEVQGFDKLLILNGHGGNDFKQMVREAQVSTPVFLSTLSWFRLPDTQDHFDAVDNHAGEMETSLMMHANPDLVLSLDQAGPGRAREWTLEAINEGWAWAPRRWSEVTDDTGVGNPALATPEKGVVFFQLVTEKIAGYLTELAGADPNNLYARL